MYIENLSKKWFKLFENMFIVFDTHYNSYLTLQLNTLKIYH